MKPPSSPSWERMAIRLQEQLDEDQLTQCMRCGFCLPACPTYRETGQEAASPRGRIAWMKAVHDDLVKPDASFVEQMHLCLGCRACEPACPAGVEYGLLLEQARSAIYEEMPQNGWQKGLTWLFLKKIIPHPQRLRLLGKVLSLYHRTGLGKWVRRTGLLRLLPRHMEEMEFVLPVPSAGRTHEGTMRRPTETPSGRAALFLGCIMDVLFSETNQHTIELLQAAGYEVVVPSGQTCCGALHAHMGDHQTAKRLAKRNIETFLHDGADLIVTNAGGCGAMLTEAARLLEKEPEWREKAQIFAERVQDISEVLWAKRDRLAFETVEPVKVTYQDSCHLRNGMKTTAPRQWIRSVKGAEFVEMVEADRCCGSAGIYNLLQPDMSTRLLDEKMEHVKNTGALWIITSNPGCLLQMKWGVKRANLPHVQTIHLVDFLHQTLKRPRTDHNDEKSPAEQRG